MDRVGGLAMIRFLVVTACICLVSSQVAGQKTPPLQPKANEAGMPTGSTAPAEKGATVGAPQGATKAPANPDQSYGVRLKELQEKVEELKSEIFDSKARLMILGEQLLSNLITEAKVVIEHVNDFSSFLVLEEVVYYLDNDKIYAGYNRDGSLNRQKSFRVFEGAASPGMHQVAVEMTVRGNGSFFTYLAGYRFTIKSSFTFFATQGYETRVRVVGYEKGGLAARLEDRPSVKFEMTKAKVVARSPITSEGGQEGETSKGTK